MTKSKLKILYALFALPIPVLSVCACGGKTENEAPEISGAVDIDCIAGESVDLLYRVAALDREDGDITPAMGIDISPAAVLKDGVAVFPHEGIYDVCYYVTDSDGEYVETYVTVTAYNRDVYKKFLDNNEFFVTTSGDAELKSEGVTDGKYTVNVIGAQKPSDAALVRMYELECGGVYNFEYTLQASAMGTLRIFADDVELAQKQIAENALGTFAFEYTVPQNDGDTDTEDDEKPDTRLVKIEVMFGSFGNDVTLALEKVKVDGTDFTYREIVNGIDDCNVSPRFDGAGGDVNADGGNATLNVTSTGDGMWRGGMYIETPIAVSGNGQKYKVTYTLTAANGNPVEVGFQPRLYNDGQTYAYRTYDNASGGVREEIEFDTYYSGKLGLYVQSGKYVNSVTVSDFKIYALESASQPIGLGTYTFDNFYESHNSGAGADASVRVENGKVIYNVKSFGATDNNNELKSSVYTVDGTTDKFIISFKAKATKPIKSVIISPVDGGWEPNLIWKSFTIDTEERYYFFTTNNVVQAGTHYLLWQFGAAENQKHTNVTVEISDVRLSYRHGLFDYDEQ